MILSKEFIKLGFYFHQEIMNINSSLDGVVEELSSCFEEVQERKNLVQYLNQILAQNLTPKEIVGMWESAQFDYIIQDPEKIKLIFTLVRDRFEKPSIS